ncbi:MAG: hypothetical protein ABSD57_15115 [Verrucomicrobiota bacterium]|jgi:hypothetical protein
MTNNVTAIFTANDRFISPDNTKTRPSFVKLFLGVFGGDGPKDRKSMAIARKAYSSRQLIIKAGSQKKARSWYARKQRQIRHQGGRKTPPNGLTNEETAIFTAGGNLQSNSRQFKP